MVSEVSETNLLVALQVVGTLFGFQENIII